MYTVQNVDRAFRTFLFTQNDDRPIADACGDARNPIDPNVSSAAPQAPSKIAARAAQRANLRSLGRAGRSGRAVVPGMGGCPATAGRYGDSRNSARGRPGIAPQYMIIAGGAYT